MKTFLECKDIVTKETVGIDKWVDFIGSAYWWRFQHEVNDKAAELYASQFKPQWLSVDQTDLLNEAPNERIVVLFDNGEIRRYEEQHPFALIVGFFVLPEPPTK